jgi:hypothetical protein
VLTSLLRTAPISLDRRYTTVVSGMMSSSNLPAGQYLLIRNKLEMKGCLHSPPEIEFSDARLTEVQARDTIPCVASQHRLSSTSVYSSTYPYAHCGYWNRDWVGIGILPN